MSDSNVVIRGEVLGKTFSLHHEQSERTTARREVVAQLAPAHPAALGADCLCGEHGRGTVVVHPECALPQPC